MKQIAFVLFVFSFGIMSVHVQAQQSLIVPGSEIIKLEGTYAFTEGPAANSKGDVFFVDDPNNKIHCWSATDKTVSVFVQESAHANGTYIDKNDNLYVCEGGTGSIVFYTPDGKRTVAANKYGDRHFNKPNDLWIDPKGGIYFTDPVYGNPYPVVQKGENVYYVSPDRSKILALLTQPEIVKPNGIIGTPDGKYLYIADIGDKKVYRYTIQPDATLTDRILFAPYAVDGMAIDEKGNVYLTENGVIIYNPEGKEIERIKFPEQPANVTFGGKEFKTLFVTARRGIYALEMNVKGAR